MSYTIVNDWTPVSKYPIKAPYAMKPIGICIHETDNNATARNEIAYMKRNNNYTSFHVAIDENEVVQSIPFNRNAWAAGDGANGIGNRRYLHFEICRNKDNGFDGPISQRLEKAYENAALYTAYVLIQEKWNTSVLRQHFDFTGKNCPRKIRKYNRWNWFKRRVDHHMREIQGKNNVVEEEKPEIPPKDTPSVKVDDDKVALEVALQDLKMNVNEWGTASVDVNGTFKATEEIMTRFGSPNIKSESGGRTSVGWKTEFDQILLAGDYAWLRYRFNDRIKYIPFATREGFESGEYWGVFE